MIVYTPDQITCQFSIKNRIGNFINFARKSDINETFTLVLIYKSNQRLITSINIRLNTSTNCAIRINWIKFRLRCPIP